MFDHNPILQKAHLNAVSTSVPETRRPVSPMGRPMRPGRVLVNLAVVVLATAAIGSQFV